MGFDLHAGFACYRTRQSRLMGQMEAAYASRAAGQEPSAAAGPIRRAATMNGSLETESCLPA